MSNRVIAKSAKRKQKTGVYAIINTANYKIYIGGAYVSFRKRWMSHRSSLALGKHANRHLQRAYNKYGKSVFKYVILERCDPDKVREAEQLRLDKYYDNGIDCYNICPIAGSNKGVKYTHRKGYIRVKVTAAEAFLRDMLIEGVVAQEIVWSKAQESNIKRGSLVTAKKNLGVITFKSKGKGGKWFWTLIEEYRKKVISPPPIRVRYI